jgi:glycosyltransferase involved in cell wall biosynthesis
MMNKVPRVSIVIPAKNEAENIGACLDSIFAINYNSSAYEVIVVDNGSEDSTVQIATEKGAQILTIPNVNISALRNLGTRHAQGDIVAFIDADCTVALDWLAQAEKYFDDEQIVCFGSAPNIPARFTWVQATWFLVRKRQELITDVLWLESMNMFVQKAIFNKVGGFDETLMTCEDVDLSYRISTYGRIVSDQNIQSVHHGEAHDITTFFRKECWRGKSNYRGLRQHGLRLKEIPSLVLPVYYLMFAILLLLNIIFGNWLYVGVICIFWQSPIAAIAFLKIHKHSAYTYFGQLLILYNVYYCARCVAIF